MSLLAEALGYVRLAELVRFRHRWEQQASLRLRDGHTTVLADYDQHGQIIGGEPEQMMDAAAAAYVALTAGGTDTLLMAADHALRRELSRQIRDELIALGIVADGPAVQIADGSRASPGDLIICTRNDRSVEAGEPGPALANGDLLRIEAITTRGLIVRRALGADPRTGQRRYQDVLMSALPPGYLKDPSHQAKWLWRTLRTAELADLDPAQILADAIGERDLAGSRDLAAVIDARLRSRLGSLVPRPAGPWSTQAPEVPDPERRTFLTQIAALMDARKDRIGEHAADHEPPWAITALGPVPTQPLDRLDWQKRAAAIGV